MVQEYPSNDYQDFVVGALQPATATGSGRVSRLRGRKSRSHGNCDAIFQIAREVVENERAMQGALNEVRHPSIVEKLDQDDFEYLDRTIVESAVEYREFALVLARLTHAAARAGGTDPEIVDAALRLDSLLPIDDTSRERDQLLRDAYTIAQRSGYAYGGRLTLARLGERAMDADDFERAKLIFKQQLEIGDENDDTPAEVDSAIQLGEICQRQGNTAEAQSYFRRATRSAMRLELPHAEAESLVRQVTLQDNRANLDAVISMQTQALGAALRTPDVSLQSRVAYDLAASEAQAGQIQNVIEHLILGVDLARQTSDVGREIDCLSGLIEAYRKLDDLGGVAFYQDELFKLEERSGNRPAAARTAIRLGQSLLTLGKPNRAKEAFARAHQIALSINDASIQQWSAGGLGAAYSETGQFSEALDFLSEALAQARNFGDTESEMDYLANIGQLLWRNNHLEDASRFLGESLSIARRLDDVPMQANLLQFQGDIFYESEQLPRAREAYNRSLDLNKRIGRTREQLALLGPLGDIAARLQHPAQTEQIYRVGLDLATATNDQEAMARFHGRLGKLAQRQKNWSGAIDHFRLAVDYAEATSSQALVAQALLHLATAQHSIGDPGAATTYRRALSAAELANDPRRIALVGFNFGLFLYEHGQMGEGLDQLYNAADIAARISPDADDLLVKIEDSIEELTPRVAAANQSQQYREAQPGFLDQPFNYGGGTRQNQFYGEATLPPE